MESALKPLTTDFTIELAKLFVFTAQVALAIRSISNYSSTAFSPSAGNDVMWLSDSLHKFDELGQAIQDGDYANIARACNGLISLYSLYEAPIPGLKSDPRDTFGRFSERVPLEEALAVFHAIKAKAVAM